MACGRDNKIHFGLLFRWNHWKHQMNFIGKQSKTKKMDVVIQIIHTEVCWTVLRSVPGAGVCFGARAGWARQSVKAANTTYDTINISGSSQVTHGRVFSKIITLYFYWAWCSPHTLLLTSSRSRGGSLTKQENVVSSCARGGLYLIYREYFFIERAVKNWKMLPGVVMESTSLKVFKNG